MQLFDHIFGDRHLTIRCFIRSSIASFGTAVLIAALTAILQPYDTRILFTEIAQDPVIGLFVIVLIATLNLIPDYISLLQSRLAIGEMGNTKTRCNRIFLFLVDLGMTALIGSVALAAWFIPEILRGHYSSYWSYFSQGLLLESSDRNLPTMGIFFYSTMFTSVWVWFYLLALILVRQASSLQVLISRGRWFLDIESHPLRSMGMILGATLCVGYWLVGALLSSAVWVT